MSEIPVVLTHLTTNRFVASDGEMWICKPTGMNQGKGIFLIRSREELLEKLGPKATSQGRQRCFPSPGRVVQRYRIYIVQSR